MNNAVKRSTVIALAAFLLAACTKTTDEEQIAQNIAAMQDAVETNAFYEIEPYLHAGFVANERLDAQKVKQLLQMYSMRHKDIDATILGSKTTMDPTFPDRAESILSVVVTGSSRRLPSDGSIRTVRLEWVKQSGEWQLRKALWEYY